MVYLDVSGGHRLYYEVHGKGRPAVILHGGPGGGMNRAILKTFQLSKWQVVLFDQRGCGKSTPFASISNNTTWDLVNDIEALRNHLGFDAWFVAGGSWGTTLALAYAQTHPTRVTGLLLRGLSLCDDESFRWMYEKGGASEIWPEGWSKFVSVLPPRLHTAGWHTIMKYFQTKLQGPSSQKFADAWWKWEQSLSFLYPQKDTFTQKQTLAIARLENHYFVHRCWLKKDQLQRGLHLLRHIPITMIHGRYDLICPISQANIVKKALPHATIYIVPDAGHSMHEKGTRRQSTRMTRRMFSQYPTRKKARE